MALCILVSPAERGPVAMEPGAGIVDEGGGVDVLGGACHDPLQSLNLSLDLLWVLLAHHVLLIKAAIVQAVGIVEEMLGLVILEKKGSIRQLQIRSQGAARRDKPNQRTSSYSSRRRLPRQEEQIPMTLSGWGKYWGSSRPLKGNGKRRTAKECGRMKVGKAKATKSNQVQERLESGSGIPCGGS